MMEEPQYLRDLWYCAALASDVKAGKLARKMLLNEPVLLGRTPAGEAFALRDICPHRGVPLSGGRFEGNDVECPYHGWRFNAGGRCTAIPSLVEGQDMDVSRIGVRNYPVAEERGLIWIFMGKDATTAPDLPHPALPYDGPGGPRFIERQVFPVSIDHTVVGLMDPAHGPFVHSSWFWRKRGSIHAKAKKYAPSPLGFTMLAHEPSKNAGLYKVLGGGITTEIAFALPSLRYEIIKAGKNHILGFTAVTPLTHDETEVTQVFYWNNRLFSLFTPLMRPFAKIFMGQDRKIVTQQREGLKYGARQMLIQDADVPAMWYHRLKKEWTEAKAEGRAFVNPVPQTTLRWRS